MKKIKKNDLKLDKEVISSLSENELFSLKGGDTTLVPIETLKNTICRPCELSKVNIGCEITPPVTQVANKCVILFTNDQNPCNSDWNGGCYTTGNNTTGPLSIGCLSILNNC